MPWICTSDFPRGQPDGVFLSAKLERLLEQVNLIYLGGSIYKTLRMESELIHRISCEYPTRQWSPRKILPSWRWKLSNSYLENSPGPGHLIQSVQRCSLGKVLNFACYSKQLAVHYQGHQADFEFPSQIPAVFPSHPKQSKQIAFFYLKMLLHWHQEFRDQRKMKLMEMSQDHPKDPKCYRRQRCSGLCFAGAEAGLGPGKVPLR